MNRQREVLKNVWEEDGSYIRLLAQIHNAHLTTSSIEYSGLAIPSFKYQNTWPRTKEGSLRSTKCLVFRNHGVTVYI